MNNFKIKRLVNVRYKRKFLEEMSLGGNIWMFAWKQNQLLDLQLCCCYPMRFTSANIPCNTRVATGEGAVGID